MKPAIKKSARRSRGKAAAPSPSTGVAPIQPAPAAPRQPTREEAMEGIDAGEPRYVDEQ
ncbi:MAG TPA: hypothetical protein VHC19_25550 [Pirellulales bacterium]|nr:hypothetical protein [Pirellulales bacterium]